MSENPSRRTVLQGLLATGALCSTRILAQPQASSMNWILIGTNKGEGIYRSRWNSETGTMGAPELAVPSSKPTYLTLHPRLPIVYACNEDDVPAAAVSAFSLDHQTAGLKPLGTEPTDGSAPCFVSVDRTGRVLFAANYSGGSLAAFPLDAKGAIKPSATVFNCAGKPVCGALGPVKDRQDGPHLHCAVLSPDQRYVLACNLGGDTILVFPIHPGAQLPLGTPTRIPTKAGSGPRHLAFHPNGRWLYCITELGCTVVLYRWNAEGGNAQAEPVPGGVVSVLPPNAPGTTTSTGAEIAFTRDGRFAYTSTRFTDVLTVFRVDASTGKLTQSQQLPCGGKTPRFFALDPTERWLLCGNQDSDSVSVFARDAHSGQLTPGNTFPATNPQCLLWV